MWRTVSAIASIAVAGVLLSTSPLLAQACNGLPMGTGSGIGARYLHADLVNGQTLDEVSADFTHKTGLAPGGLYGVLGLGAGRGFVSRTPSDRIAGYTPHETRIHGLATLELSPPMPASPVHLSVCATTGVIYSHYNLTGQTALHHMIIPATGSIGLTFNMGLLSITPYVAPTLAIDRLSIDNGSTTTTTSRHDSYLEAGASVKLLHLVVGAATMIRRAEYDNKPAFLLRADLLW